MSDAGQETGREQTPDTDCSAGSGLQNAGTGSREPLRVLYEPHGVSLSARELHPGCDRDHGEQRREACILLHGFGDGAFVWALFAPYLTTDLRTLAIDFRGHGDSSWDLLARYSVEWHVADILHVIDTLGLERYVLVGHSLGGAVALQIAARRPTAVKGILVVDYGPDINAEGAARVRSDFHDSLRRWSSIAEYAQWLRERRPLINEVALSHIASMALRRQPDGSFRLRADPALDSESNSASLPRAAEVWHMLRGIPAPVTVVRGVGSAVLSESVVAKMTRILPNSRAVTVGTAGHAVLSDNPVEFSRVLQSFLSQVTKV
jgi:pimeloyl-ACP methyl ester carboxylesterase